MLSAKDLLATHQLATQEQTTLQAMLLMQAQQQKRETADLAAGRLVRIKFFPPGQEEHSGLYPARVAAFICKVLGQSVSAGKGICFSFTSQGRLNQSYYRADRAQLAILALISHASARHKWHQRGLARWQARLKREAATH